MTLTSGLHSANYFQCALVLQHPQCSQFLAKKIVDHFINLEIDTVISPAIGGIVVGQEVGRQLGIRTIFAERKDGKMQLRHHKKMMTGIGKRSGVISLTTSVKLNTSVVG